MTQREEFIEKTKEALMHLSICLRGRYPVDPKLQECLEGAYKLVGHVYRTLINENAVIDHKKNT